MSWSSLTSINARRVRSNMFSLAVLVLDHTFVTAVAPQLLWRAFRQCVNQYSLYLGRHLSAAIRASAHNEHQPATSVKFRKSREAEINESEAWRADLLRRTEAMPCMLVGVLSSGRKTTRFGVGAPISPCYKRTQHVYCWLGDEHTCASCSRRKIEYRGIP